MKEIIFQTRKISKEHQEWKTLANSVKCPHSIKVSYGRGEDFRIFVKLSFVILVHSKQSHGLLLIPIALMCVCVCVCVCGTRV
jgi:hypothetical protein